MISDELREDLADLREAIEAVEIAIATGDPEAVVLAKIDCLALIQSLAYLHCSIVESVLAERRAINRRMGCREICVPADYEGLWLITKPRKPVELPK